MTGKKWLGISESTLDMAIFSASNRDHSIN